MQQAPATARELQAEGEPHEMADKIRTIYDLARVAGVVRRRAGR